MTKRKSKQTSDRETNPYRERVFRLVQKIPRGRVVTYGQIADALGEGYTPRTVGFVMHSADENSPWHRVINAQGGCSTASIILPADRQQRMLEAEGVEFDARGRCDLERYRCQFRQVLNNRRSASLTKPKNAPKKKQKARTPTK